MSVIFPINVDPRFRLSTAVGGETTASVPFPFQDNDDIALVKIDVDGVEMPWTEGVHYTLTGAGNPAGGSAAFASPLVAGEKILRIGKSVLDRLRSVTRDGRFSSLALDEDFDRWIMIAQEFARELRRAVKLPLGSQEVDLPAPQPNHVWRWNADGTALESIAVASQQQVDEALEIVDTALAILEASTELGTPANGTVDADKITSDPAKLAAILAKLGLNADFIDAPKITNDAIKQAAIVTKLGLGWQIPDTGPRNGPQALQGGRSVFLGNDALTVINQQELAAWYKRLLDGFKQIDARTFPVTNSNIYWFGDSKVAGSNTAGYQFKDLMYKTAARAGFPFINSYQYGWGGEDSVDLTGSGRIDYVMGGGGFAECGLFIINVGTNEAHPTTPRTLAQTDTAVRYLIDRLRNTGASPAGRTGAQMSILLMAQTTGNVTLNNATQAHMRELNSLYRKIAIDKNVAFYDPYANFPRPHYDAAWMDDLYTLDPMYGHTSVHPLDTFMMAIVSQMVEIIFPRTMCDAIGMAPNDRLGATLLAATPPYSYPYGHSADRATLANGFPIDGHVETFRAANGLARQTLYDYSNSRMRFRTNSGFANAWNGWSSTLGA